MISSQTQLNVIGLGYVGLPLAVALADRFATVGLDISASRVAALQAGVDRTGEIPRERLLASPLKVTDNPLSCPAAEFYIVTVPTPIDAKNRPDLSLVEAASLTVGTMLQRTPEAEPRPIVVYESTVYPGVTEEICAPLLESVSGLVCGKDFFVAYSPERINPGDREHTVDKITKVVSGQTPEVLERVAQLYGAITTGGVFRATSIKAAEAAKVIENAQRDINIAFMNEIAQIFARVDLSVWDVLDAARTKWNFLPFSPGLVGGHCIGVDPFYLSSLATRLGHHPQVILAGRQVNDAMADWVAERLDTALGRRGRCLVLGLSFKEDVPDLRNSKVADLIAGLTNRGHEVALHDPHVDPVEAMSEYGFAIDETALERSYDMVVLAVPHRRYLDMGAERIRALAVAGGLVADLRNGFGGALGGWRL